MTSVTAEKIQVGLIGSRQELSINLTSTGKRGKKEQSGAPAGSADVLEEARHV